MFCLRDHLPGDECWIRRIVCDHEQLTRTGERIDSNPVRKLAFCFRNIGITWPDDAIDMWDGFSAECHCRNSSGTTDCEDGVHASERGCRKNNPGWKTIRCGRS